MEENIRNISKECGFSVIKFENNNIHVRFRKDLDEVCIETINNKLNTLNVVFSKITPRLGTFKKL